MELPILFGDAPGGDGSRLRIAWLGPNHGGRRNGRADRTGI
jgi:hypothetical protein